MPKTQAASVEKQMTLSVHFVAFDVDAKSLIRSRNSARRSLRVDEKQLNTQLSIFSSARFSSKRRAVKKDNNKKKPMFRAIKRLFIWMA